MSDLNTPMFSFKQYVDDMQKLKQTGTVDAGIQKQSPRSAGSRGLAKTHQFTKEPVHMMGEQEEGQRPSPSKPNPNTNESSLIAKRDNFNQLLAKKIMEPQTGLGKKEHDPRLMARIWKILTGDEVQYDQNKDTFIVKKKTAESIFESWLDRRIPEKFHNSTRKWFKQNIGKFKK
jgi:hypothetical protein